MKSNAKKFNYKCGFTLIDFKIIIGFVKICFYLVRQGKTAVHISKLIHPLRFP